jgi:hypothetical protein
LLHYGERNVALAESLFGRCTGLQELLVCFHQQVAGAAPLRDRLRGWVGRRAVGCP